MSEHWIQPLLQYASPPSTLLCQVPDLSVSGFSALGSEAGPWLSSVRCRKPGGVRMRKHGGKGGGQAPEPSTIERALGPGLSSCCILWDSAAASATGPHLNRERGSEEGWEVGMVQ